MAHDHGQRCLCVAEHRPPYLELHAHHLLPIFMGGPRDGEVAYICPTTHGATHELLRLMVIAGRVVTYRECQDLEPRPVARYAHGLAVEGFTRWRATRLASQP